MASLVELVSSVLSSQFPYIWLSVFDIKVSILLVREDQSTLVQHHLIFYGKTGWYLILWLMMMEIDSCSELLISSTSDHDILIDQLQPKSDKSSVLSFPVIQPV